MARKITRKGIIRKLDKRVSEIVRARDKACVICGSRESLTAGHIFSRVNYSTRWDLENVWCQCITCNYRHEQDAWPFYKWFIRNFGEDKFEELRLKHHQLTHFKDFHLQEMLDELNNTYLIND